MQKRQRVPEEELSTRGCEPQQRAVCPLPDLASL